jgi:hypothetical protein
MVLEAIDELEKTFQLKLIFIWDTPSGNINISEEKEKLGLGL